MNEYNINNITTFGDIVKNNIDNKYKNICRILSEIYENPNEIFNHKLFSNEEDAIYFRNCLVLGTHDEHLFEQFQEQFCNYGITKLINKLPLENLNLSINTDNFFWSIVGWYKEDIPIMIIYPYTNEVLILNNILEEDIMEQESLINENIKNCQETIDFLTECVKKPLMYNTESNSKILKTILFKKASINDIKQQLEIYKLDFNNLINERNELLITKENTRTDIIYFEQLKNNIISRLKNMNFIVKIETIEPTNQIE